MKNFVYILKCKDDSLYTGWTNDLQARVRAHNLSLGAKYTRGRTPCLLVYFEEFETKQKAMSREYEIKHLSKKEKLDLIKKRNDIE